MKLYKYIIAACLLILFLVTPNVADAASSRVALINDVKGTVYIKMGGGKKEIKAAEGMSVAEGYTIRTEGKSSITIEYDDGTESTLGANSKVLISDLDGKNGKKTKLKVVTGKLWNSVKNILNINDKYDVETPTAVMGVRGTLFLVTADPVTGETKVSVLDGEVATEANTSGADAEEQLVTLNEELSVMTSSELLSKKQDLDTIVFVKSTDSQILVKVITDVIEKSSSANQQATEIQESFKQSGKKEDILKALKLSKTANSLSLLEEMLIKQIKEQGKTQEINELLKESKKTLEQIEQQTTKLQEETKKTVEKVTDAAKANGVSEKEMKEVLPNAEKVKEQKEKMTVAKPVERPVPAPSGEYNPPVENPRVGQPTAYPTGEYITAGTMVRLTSATPGAKIFFTVDGSVPTSASHQYVEPFPIYEDTTVKAIAILNGKSSEMITISYKIQEISATASILIKGLPDNTLPELYNQVTLTYYDENEEIYVKTYLHNYSITTTSTGTILSIFGLIPESNNYIISAEINGYLVQGEFSDLGPNQIEWNIDNIDDYVAPNVIINLDDNDGGAASKNLEDLQIIISKHSPFNSEASDDGYIFENVMSSFTIREGTKIKPGTYNFQVVGRDSENGYSLLKTAQEINRENNKLTFTSEEIAKLTFQQEDVNLKPVHAVGMLDSDDYFNSFRHVNLSYSKDGNKVYLNNMYVTKTKSERERMAVMVSYQFQKDSKVYEINYFIENQDITSNLTFDLNTTLSIDPGWIVENYEGPIFNNTELSNYLVPKVTDSNGYIINAMYEVGNSEGLINGKVSIINDQNYEKMVDGFNFSYFTLNEISEGLIGSTILKFEVPNSPIEIDPYVVEFLLENNDESCIENECYPVKEIKGSINISGVEVPSDGEGLTFIVRAYPVGYEANPTNEVDESLVSSYPITFGVEDSSLSYDLYFQGSQINLGYTLKLFLLNGDVPVFVDTHVDILYPFDDTVLDFFITNEQLQNIPNPIGDSPPPDGDSPAPDETA
ncbi:chitobiase/beta-hexosaminidase C-terminal domain-containing protein [Bacillus sp. CGMCC 1.16607]|uniref:chitobiase/beta-hexosaminidase C-terminal domain-containing protein n=1 Tax=Bacillus sp. CGMCC 1.16607 TaxID=3351842 RepID=UPI00363877C1